MSTPSLVSVEERIVAQKLILAVERNDRAAFDRLASDHWSTVFEVLLRWPEGRGSYTYGSAFLRECLFAREVRPRIADLKARLAAATLRAA